MGTILAGRYGPEGLEFPDGRPARNTPVTVLNSNGDLATLFVDKEKTSQAANPVVTDEFGNLTFRAAPGDYQIVVNGSHLPIVVPIDASEFSVDRGALDPFEFIQTVPATVWGPIQHNFGREPIAWVLRDLDGRECRGYNLQSLDQNTCRVSMEVPSSGTIRII